MEFTLTFILIFWEIVQIVAPVLALQVLIIILLGQVAGRFEKWSAAETLYWSFITATTVGYGDMRPVSRTARVLAVVIALNGLILFGVVASIAVSATTDAVRLHADLSGLEEVTGEEYNTEGNPQN